MDKLLPRNYEDNIHCFSFYLLGKSVSELEHVQGKLFLGDCFLREEKHESAVSEYSHIIAQLKSSLAKHAVAPTATTPTKRAAKKLQSAQGKRKAESGLTTSHKGSTKTSQTKLSTVPSGSEHSSGSIPKAKKDVKFIPSDAKKPTLRDVSDLPSEESLRAQKDGVHESAFQPDHKWPIGNNWPPHTLVTEVVFTLEQQCGIVIKDICQRLLYFLGTDNLKSVLSILQKRCLAPPKLSSIALSAVVLKCMMFWNEAGKLKPTRVYPCQEVLPPRMDDVSQFSLEDYPITNELIQHLTAVFFAVPKQKIACQSTAVEVRHRPCAPLSAIASSEATASSPSSELLLAHSLIKRAYCLLQLSRFEECIADCESFWTLTNVTSEQTILMNLYKAKALFNLAKLKKMQADELNTGHLLPGDTVGSLRHRYEEAISKFKDSSLYYARTLELMQTSEFEPRLAECNPEMITSQHEVLRADLPGSKYQLKTCCLCWRNVKGSLENSHAFPRFVLRLLAQGGKVRHKTEIKGIKDVAWKMLCSQCEEKFSGKGEVQFNKAFELFLKDPASAHKIFYKEWLHFFLLSIVWRLVLVDQVTDISCVLESSPFMMIRRYLLSGDPGCLPITCPVYVYIDRDTHSDISALPSNFIHQARKGLQFKCDPTEFFFAHFWWFFVVVPFGKSLYNYLWQNSLSYVKVGNGELAIPEENQRIVPVFIETQLLHAADVSQKQHQDMSDKEHDLGQRALASGTLPHSLPTKIREMEEKTEESPVVYTKHAQMWLPRRCQVSYEDQFPHGLDITGDCEVHSRIIIQHTKPYQALWLCTYKTGKQFALLRSHVYKFSCSADVTIAFDFQCDGSRVIDVQVMDEIPNKRDLVDDICENYETYWKATLESVKTHIQIMLESQLPTPSTYYLPEGFDLTMVPSLEYGLATSGDYRILCKPISLCSDTVAHSYHIWLCQAPNGQKFGLFRFVKPKQDSSGPPVDYVIPYHFSYTKDNFITVKVMDEVLERLKENAIARNFALSRDPAYAKLRAITAGAIEVMNDMHYQESHVILCLPSDWQVEFDPIDKPGVLTSPGFHFVAPLLTHIEDGITFTSYLYSSEDMHAFRMLLKYELRCNGKKEQCIALWIPVLQGFEPISVTSDISVSDERYLLVDELLQMSSKAFANTMFFRINSLLKGYLKKSLKLQYARKIKEETVPFSKVEEFPRTLSVDLLSLAPASLDSQEPDTRERYPPVAVCPGVRAEITPYALHGLKLFPGNFIVLQKPYVCSPAGKLSELTVWLCCSPSKKLFIVAHFVLVACGIDVLFAATFHTDDYIYCSNVSTPCLIEPDSSTLVPLAFSICRSKLAHCVSSLLQCHSVVGDHYLPRGCHATLGTRTSHGLILSAGFRVECKPIRTPEYTFWLCCEEKSAKKFVVFRMQHFVRPHRNMPYTDHLMSLQFESDGSTQTIPRFLPFESMSDESKETVKKLCLSEEIGNYQNPYIGMLTAAVEVMLRPHYCEDNIQRFVPLECDCHFEDNGRLVISGDKFTILAGPTPTMITGHGLLEYKLCSWLCSEVESPPFCLTLITVCDEDKMLVALDYDAYDSHVTFLQVNPRFSRRQPAVLLCNSEIRKDMCSTKSRLGICLSSQISYLIEECRSSREQSANLKEEDSTHKDSLEISPGPPEMKHAIQKTTPEIRDYFPDCLQGQVHIDYAGDTQLTIPEECKIVAGPRTDSTHDTCLTLSTWACKRSGGDVRQQFAIVSVISHTSQTNFAVSFEIVDEKLKFCSLHLLKGTPTCHELITLYTLTKAQIFIQLYHLLRQSMQITAQMHVLPGALKTVEFSPDCPNEIQVSKDILVLSRPLQVSRVTVWHCALRRRKKEFLLVRAFSDCFSVQVPRMELVFPLTFDMKGDFCKAIQSATFLSPSEVLIIDSICFGTAMFPSSPLPNMLIDFARILLSTNFTEANCLCFLPVGVSAKCGDELELRGSKAVAGPQQLIDIPCEGEVYCISGWLSLNDLNHQQLLLKFSAPGNRDILLMLDFKEDDDNLKLSIPANVCPQPKHIVSCSLVENLLNESTTIGSCLVTLLRVLLEEFSEKGVTQVASGYEETKQPYPGKLVEKHLRRAQKQSKVVFQFLPAYCIADLPTEDGNGLQTSGMVYHGPLKLHSPVSSDATAWLGKCQDDTVLFTIRHSLGTKDILYSAKLVPSKDGTLSLELMESCRNVQAVTSAFSSRQHSLTSQACILLHPEQCVLKMHILPPGCTVVENLGLTGNGYNILCHPVETPFCSVLLCSTPDDKVFALCHVTKLPAATNFTHDFKYSFVFSVDFTHEPDGTVTQLRPMHLIPEQLGEIMNALHITTKTSPFEVATLIQVALDLGFKQDHVQRYLPHGCDCSFNDNTVQFLSSHEVLAGPECNTIEELEISCSLWLCSSPDACPWTLLKLTVDPKITIAIALDYKKGKDQTIHSVAIRPDLAPPPPKVMELTVLRDVLSYDNILGQWLFHSLSALVESDLISRVAPHGKTIITKKYTAMDFGPLNALPGLKVNNDAVRSFRGGSYMQTRPMTEAVQLYRLYDERNAPKAGQYWTVEPREGNLSYRMDVSVKEEWNKLTQQVSIKIPVGIFLYEGYSATEGAPYFGGGWQVFIPLAVVQPLMERQLIIESCGSSPTMEQERQIQELLELAVRKQQEMILEYEHQKKQAAEDYLQHLTSPRHALRLLKFGNQLENLPHSVQDGLSQLCESGGKVTMTEGHLPTGTFTVHKEAVSLPDGSARSMTLLAHVKEQGLTSPTEQPPADVVHKYEVDTQWK